MDMEKLKAEITFDEGRRLNPYPDTKGIWTGGVGHNLQAHGIPMSQIQDWRTTGIPVELVDKWLDEDIATAALICNHVFRTFGELSNNRQRVLVNMAFDLAGELADWHGLQKALIAQDWTGASMEIMHSYFDEEAPNRCGRLAARMVEG